MTPMPDLGASAGASGIDLSGSASSAIDSLLDAPDSTVGAPGAEEVQPEPESEEIPAQEEIPVDEEIPAETDPTEDPDEEIVDSDGRKRYHVKPERMKALIQHKNFVKAIEEYAPTVEAVVGLHQNASDFRAMQIEFQGGSPEAASKFLEFWGEAPEGLQSLSQALPQYLATNNPQALQALEGRVAGAFANRMAAIAEGRVDIASDPTIQGLAAKFESSRIDRAYAAAIRSGNPEEFTKAQNIDFYLTGKFKTPEQVQAQAASRPRIDEAQQQQQMQQRRAQELDQRENNFIRGQWDGFDKQNLTGAKETSLQQDIDAAFKPVEKSYSKEMLSALKREAKAKVEEALKGSFEWDRNHRLEVANLQREFSAAVKANKPTDAGTRAQQLVNDYRARAARALPGIVKPLIAGATQKVVADNAATHQRLAAGAARSAPGGGGRPAPRSIVDSSKWKSAGEGLDALLG